ncbi:unnamed protein product [Vitrella brassicaformis CCMP3155]|uniref:Uncharacterized protein n=1 Tax=Vitrella brassicaformis (strain CCMP3155) TaxID=1169540 RepID=A0A0G4G338_VITBC|nr:unnamed protein product [Vitrella brassicaformis CCMP3155]|eukprot:CEM22149.1 unnamed protein product [Vitrella brassicaformis CCMP3155]
MLSALLYALALMATPSGSLQHRHFPDKKGQKGDRSFEESIALPVELAGLAVETNDTALQLSVLRTIREDIADSTQPQEEAMGYAGFLTRLLERSRDSDVEREAVVLLAHLLQVAPKMLIEPSTLMVAVQLLDRHDEFVVTAATALLAQISVAPTGVYGLAELPSGLADVFSEYGAVSRISPLLLSTNHDALHALFVAVVSLHQMARKRRETVPVSMAQMIDAEVLPNLMRAYRRETGVFGRPMEALTHIPLMSCLFPWKWGNETASNYAVDHGCVDVICDTLESRIIMYPESVDACKQILLRLAKSGSVALKMRIASQMRVRRRVSDDALPSSFMLRIFRAAGSGLYRLPKSLDLVSSPWAPWVAVALAVLLGLSALWRFVVGPWLQRRQQLQAEDTAAELIAEEEREWNRGQGRGRRRHARQTYASAAEPIDKPSSAAADDDGGSATTTSQSGCLTPTSLAYQQEEQEETMAADSNQSAPTPRHRKKKGRRGGSGGADASLLQQQADQSSSSHETTPPQQTPNSASSISVTGPTANRPSPTALPFVTPPLKQHSSSSAAVQQQTNAEWPSAAGSASAAADGCASVGSQRPEGVNAELSSGSPAVVALSLSPGSPSDDSAWVRGMEAAW